MFYLDLHRENVQNGEQAELLLNISKSRDTNYTTKPWFASAEATAIEVMNKLSEKRSECIKLLHSSKTFE